MGSSDWISCYDGNGCCSWLDGTNNQTQPARAVDSLRVIFYVFVNDNQDVTKLIFILCNNILGILKKTHNNHYFKCQAITKQHDNVTHNENKA